MKYIRTKNGIFNIEKLGGIRTIVKLYDVDKSLRLKYENTNEPQQVGDRFVIIENKDYKITDNNIADTIEELCDAWIIIPKGVNCNPFTRNINEDISHFMNDSHIIYGAIWIIGEFGEPILKSVAKLNERGDLELL